MEWKQRPIDVFNGDKRVAQYRISGYDVGLDAGIQPWMYGEARVGLLLGHWKADPRIGNVELPLTSINRGAITASATLDQLDNVNFPNKGYWARFNSFYSLRELGAEDNYNKVEGTLGGALTFRKQTVIASLRGGSHIGNDIPFYDEFELGGFMSLSGLRFNQLRGQNLALGRIITYHRVGHSFIGDLYLGGSLEAGNVWDGSFRTDDLQLAGSIFVGYDTILGPLYLGFGHAEQGRNAGYFYLGRTF